MGREAGKLNTGVTLEVEQQRGVILSRENLDHTKPWEQGASDLKVVGSPRLLGGGGVWAVQSEI